jgi:hypothetical protein
MDNWLAHATDIEVTIRPRRDNRSFDNGKYNYKRAVIRASENARTARVIVRNDARDVESIPVEFLEPVRPDGKGRVKVLAGTYAGEPGELLSIDDTDGGIVKLFNRNVYERLPLRFLGIIQ